MKQKLHYPEFAVPNGCQMSSYPRYQNDIRKVYLRVPSDIMKRPNHFSTNVLSHFVAAIQVPSHHSLNNVMHTWSDNKVHKLITVKVLHSSLLNTTMVAFKVLPLGRYAPMPTPSPPFKTILELVLWNGLQSCHCITPNVIKMPSFQYFLYLREQKKITRGQIR